MFLWSLVLALGYRVFGGGFGLQSLESSGWWPWLSVFVALGLVVVLCLAVVFIYEVTSLR